MIDLIRTRLKTAPQTAAVFKAVEGLAELAALSGPPIVKPAAYVFPLREDAEPNESIGRYSQKLDVTIGVMIFAQNLRDATGAAALEDIGLLRLAVRDVLFGWTPPGWQPLQLGSGALVDASGGVIQWQDSFSTWARISAAFTE